jgi:nitrate/TMAO reductase-like tetraheme cytochrome c subunit
MRWLWFTSVATLVALHAAGAAELSAGELKDARKLYNAKCAKCHKFYDPAKYNDAEWRKWMTKMSKKARLKPAQEELLSRYLGEYRSAIATNAVSPGSQR